MAVLLELLVEFVLATETKLSARDERLDCRLGRGGGICFWGDEGTCLLGGACLWGDGGVMVTVEALLGGGGRGGCLGGGGGGCGGGEVGAIGPLAAPPRAT